METYAIGVEVLIWLAGLVALWRIGFARRPLAAPALAAWPLTVEAFAIGVASTIGGALALTYGVAHLGERWLGAAARDCAWWEVVQGTAFQLGLLAGLILAALYIRLNHRSCLTFTAVDPTPLRSAPTRLPLLAGVTVFLLAIPVINGIGIGWKAVVEALGFPINEQDMVGRFRTIDDPLRWLCMVTLATVLAPVTEELVFRLGLFRFLRARLPRGLALTVSAIVFALLHGNLVAAVPLFVFGLILARAYEQTGCISVPIIAHALFNLHTILLLMAGLTD